MSALTTLLAHPAIWRGDQLGNVTTPSLPTGFAALDAELPGDGWPTATIIEILPQHEGIGELRLLGHALANLSASGRWLVWIAPPYLPYAPALQAAGIDLARLLFIKTHSPRETLWAIEQAIRSAACGAVLGWPDKITYPEMRRLQLAAEGNPVLAVLFRPASSASETSPATLRLSLESKAGDLAVRILKRRGALLGHPILLRPLEVVSTKESLDQDATPPGKSSTSEEAPLPKDLNQSFPNQPAFKNHVMDRTQFPAAGARIVPSAVSAA